jgi:hypothetical protein
LLRAGRHRLLYLWNGRGFFSSSACTDWLWVSFPVSKEARLSADHSLPSSAEVKNVWSSPPRTACCLNTGTIFLLFKREMNCSGSRRCAVILTKPCVRVKTGIFYPVSTYYENLIPCDRVELVIWNGSKLYWKSRDGQLKKIREFFSCSCRMILIGLNINLINIVRYFVWS